MDEVIQAISIGLIVAHFLYNTNRVLRSIEISKECLAIFKQTKTLIKDDKLAKSLYKMVYLIMSNAYHAINDDTNAIKYTENILQIYPESGEKLQEYKLSSNLAKVFFCQSKYTEVRELYARALLISTEIRDRNREASCYINLGGVYLCIKQLENMTKRAYI